MCCQVIPATPACTLKIANIVWAGPPLKSRTATTPTRHPPCALLFCKSMLRRAKLFDLSFLIAKCCPFSELGLWNYAVVDLEFQRPILVTVANK